MLKVNYRKLVEQTGILRYILPSEYEQIIGELMVTTMRFVNNQIILRQDDRAEQIAIVIDGEVKAEKIHGSGTDSMPHTYLPGDMFAYEGIVSSSKKYPLDYISDGDSIIAFLDLESVKNSAFSREIMQGIIGYMADESIKRMYRIEVISRKKVRDRILTYLQIEEKESGIYALDISREKMAEELCVNRSALSNEISKLHREGIIKIDKRKIGLK